MFGTFKITDLNIKYNELYKIKKGFCRKSVSFLSGILPKIYNSTQVVFPTISQVHMRTGLKLCSPKRKNDCISSFSPDSYPYVSSLVCAFFMCLTPLWIVISSKHPASRTLLYSGWEPVITAMVISRSVFVCVCDYVCVYVF